MSAIARKLIDDIYRLALAKAEIAQKIKAAEVELESLTERIDQLNADSDQRPAERCVNEHQIQRAKDKSRHIRMEIADYTGELHRNAAEIQKKEHTLNGVYARCLVEE